MAEKRDYYEVLGLSKDASQDQIRSAYLKLAKQYHPDLNKSPDAPAKFKEVSEAYEVLKDPQKKAAYDQFGFAGVDPQAAGAGAGQGGFGGFGDVDVGDIFSQFFGGGQRTSRKQTGPVKGNDQAVKIRISFMDAINGTKIELPIEYDDVCDRCNGTGSEPGAGEETCPYCHGTGYVKTQQRTIFGVMESTQPCSHCHGKGRISHDKCHKCGGNGYVHVSSKIQVAIPAGIDDGEQIRIVGKGQHGYNGGPSGDLYIVVNVDSDSRFRREDKDIHVNAPVSVIDLILGTTITVPTVYGNVDVQIKPGTATDAVLRLRGNGVKSRRGYETSGDEFIHLSVIVPQKITPEQKELLEKFEGIETSKKDPNFFKNIFHKK